MKPCFGNRKQLALLAIGGLTRGSENTLRAHLEACPGCRAYLAEISSVTVKLKAIEPDSEIRASDDFHRKTVAAIEALKSETQLPRFELPQLLNWRLALPAVAVLAISLAVLSGRLGKSQPGQRTVASADASARHPYLSGRLGDGIVAGGTDGMVSGGTSRGAARGAEASLPGQPANRQADLEPTVGRYELVANESLDKLDELIARQAKRSTPSAPVMTATFFPRSDISD
jgi:hypothetical protein